MAKITTTKAEVTYNLQLTEDEMDLVQACVMAIDWFSQRREVWDRLRTLWIEMNDAIGQAGGMTDLSAPDDLFVARREF